VLSWLRDVRNWWYSLEPSKQILYISAVFGVSGFVIFSITTIVIAIVIG